MNSKWKNLITKKCNIKVIVITQFACPLNIFMKSWFKKVYLNSFIIYKVIILIHSHKAASQSFRFSTTWCTSHWSCYQSSLLGSSSSRCSTFSFSSCRRFSSFASRKTPKKSMAAAKRTTDPSHGSFSFPSWLWLELWDFGCRLLAFLSDVGRWRLRKW